MDFEKTPEIQSGEFEKKPAVQSGEFEKKSALKSGVFEKKAAIQSGESREGSLNNETKGTYYKALDSRV